jgi:cobalt-zinc-cadmium resistance protein CzcA
MSIKIYRYVAVLYWILFGGGLLFGQVALTEEEAVRMVLQSHPSMQSAALKVRGQSIMSGTARQWEPAEIFHNIAADPDYGMFGTTAFGVSQAFPGKKMTSANRAYYERQRALAEAGLNVTRQQLDKSVRELYLHLEFIEQEATLYRRLDSMYRAVALVAADRYAAGEAALAEKLALEDKAAKMRMALETTGHEIEFDRVVLQQLLGLKEPVQPVLQAFERLSFTIGDTALVENSAFSRYSLAEVSVAASQEEIIRAKRAPTFSGGLLVQYMPNGLVLPGWQMGLRLPIGTKTLRAAQEAAAVQVQVAGADYSAELLRQRNELAHLLHEQEKYDIQIRYYEERGKALGTELLRSASLNYLNGEISFVELTQTAEQAALIEINYLENLFGLNMTVIELRALTGK